MTSSEKRVSVVQERLVELAGSLGVDIIEDCAHTMGASWNGVPSGTHGVAACYSTQTYKHINSGEGGLMITRSPELAARATILSGSYMLYERHGAIPAPEYFEDVRLDTPNCSGRMDNLRAAILRPQLADLAHNVARWNERYGAMQAVLQDVPGLYLPHRPQQEFYVGSSIQFLLDELDAERIQAFLESCAQRGVELKWFGAAEPSAFTSRHDSWRYLEPQSLPQTDAILSRLCDMRIPLTFSREDCVLIARIIASTLAECQA
jgi:dTDP-4-amino-4,6-dideoxygalactose transaminase